jgi:hypothetical protein
MQLEIVAQFSWEIRLILNGFVKCVKSGLLRSISGHRDTCGGDYVKSYSDYVKSDYVKSGPQSVGMQRQLGRASQYILLCL